MTSPTAAVTPSDPAAPPATNSTETTMDITATDRQPFRWPVALLGATIAALGVSGIVDDSGLLTHPWWSVLVLALVVVALAVIVRTVRFL